MKNILWAFKNILKAVYNLIYDLIYLPYWRTKYMPTYKGKYEVIFTSQYAIEKFKTSIRISVMSLRLELMKSYYRKLIPNLKRKIMSHRLIQYIYWKLRINAIKLRLINGKSWYKIIKHKF